MISGIKIVNILVIRECQTFTAAELDSLMIDLKQNSLLDVMRYRDY